MKRDIVCLLILLLFGLSCNKPQSVTVDQIESQSDPLIDSDTAEVLEKINSVSAYEVPDLGIRKDENYAQTAQEFEPFRHVQPYKEYFLEQLEYTGPGRSIPEPEHVDTVKIGFIGPIMSTVSVATGGKSHEEPLGIKMLQGTRLAIEQANAEGGYRKRNIPFELVISNDNGLWGASGNEIIKLAYKDKVWAILGTIPHLSKQISPGFFAASATTDSKVICLLITCTESSNSNGLVLSAPATVMAASASVKSLMEAGVSAIRFFWKWLMIWERRISRCNWSVLRMQTWMQLFIGVTDLKPHMFSIKCALWA